VESITIGQIISAIGGLTVIVGFFVAIFKWYKKNITDKFSDLNNRLKTIEYLEKNYKKELQDSKEERFILLRGQLACLKGLRDDLNCNGPVSQGIKDLEEYLIRKSHE
jgi:predicted histidine transporter YuiF (NhaC family)